MSVTVLVVDDSRTVRQQVVFTCKRAGYATLEADDGDVALEIIKTNSDIDIVISDVNMRRMSGLEMLQAVFESDLSLKVPIVMLTTEAAPQFIETAKKYGAKAWLIKPFEPAQLVSVIVKVLGK